MESGISLTIEVRNPSSIIRDWNSVPGIRIPWRGIWIQDNLGFPYIWVEYAHNKGNIFRHFKCWLQFPLENYRSLLVTEYLFFLFPPSLFNSIMRSVFNSMLLIAMMIICVHRKSSNKRPRGVYLILRVQEGSKSQHRYQNPRIGSFLSSLVFPYFDRNIEQVTIC